MANRNIIDRNIAYFDSRFRKLPVTRSELLRLDEEWRAFAEANPKDAQAYIKKDWGLIELFSVSLIYCSEEDVFI